MEKYFSDNVWTLRKSKGMSREDLSNSLGVSVSTIGGWETNYSTPKFDMIFEVADFFGISVGDLLTKKLVEGENLDNGTYKVSENTGKETGKVTGKLLESNEISELENRIKILEVELSAARNELSTKDTLIVSLQEQITLYKRLQATISSK